jgi:uncharacterized protein involved in outer membrane biogenesis
MTRKKHRWQKITVGIILTLVIVLVVARMYLPFWVKNYVNKEIDNLDSYSGSVADIDISLWRGAYQIVGLQIFKDSANIPVPFVAIDTADLSVQWKALFDGAIVAEIDLYNADLNFAVDKSGGEMQTGEGAGWAKLVDALSPLDINRLSIHGGEVSFKDFSASQKVDIFVKDIAFEVENLRDVKDNDRTLPSPVRLSGVSIGGGKVNASGAMNIIRDVPDFDLDIKLEGASLPAINNYARSLAGVDFESGDLSIYVEAAARKGQLTGYIKPIANNVSMVDIESDGDPLSLAWQSLVSVFAEIFKNQPEDQLATRIPLVGNMNNPETDSWTAFVGIFRNTFNAYIRDTDDLVEFSRTSGG